MTRLNNIASQYVTLWGVKNTWFLISFITGIKVLGLLVLLEEHSLWSLTVEISEPGYGTWTMYVILIKLLSISSSVKCVLSIRSGKKQNVCHTIKTECWCFFPKLCLKLLYLVTVFKYVSGWKCFCFPREGLCIWFPNECCVLEP